MVQANGLKRQCVIAPYPSNVGWLRYTAPVRYVVIAALLLIIGSLFSALYFVMKDKGQSDRAVRALTVRVALSVGLFLLLMIGYYFGLFEERL